MSAVGIFGGTFNPVHNGHLITTRFVKEARNLDKIIFIPNHISPHKQDILTTNSYHRLNMLKLAIENQNGYEISEFELINKEISYTILTLEELKNSYDHLELIIGYDNFLTFNKWFRYEDILKMATLTVMKRSTDIKAENEIYFDNTVFVDTPVIDISSTEIRNRIKNNMPIDFLVPESVQQYIEKNNLFSG